MQTILLYPLLTASCWYLLARSVALSWLWSRYPRWLAIPMDCASCAGLYAGITVSAVFRRDILGLPGHLITTHLIVGLLSIVWTPLLAALHQRAMLSLGTALNDHEETP